MFFFFSFRKKSPEHQSFSTTDFGDSNDGNGGSPPPSSTTIEMSSGLASTAATTSSDPGLASTSAATTSSGLSFELPSTTTTTTTHSYSRSDTMEIADLMEDMIRFVLAGEADEEEDMVVSEERSKSDGGSTGPPSEEHEHSIQNLDELPLEEETHKYIILWSQINTCKYFFIDPLTLRKRIKISRIRKKRHHHRKTSISCYAHKNYMQIFFYRSVDAAAAENKIPTLAEACDLIIAAGIEEDLRAVKQERIDLAEKKRLEREYIMLCSQKLHAKNFVIVFMLGHLHSRSISRSQKPRHH
jgi:hypothetical protein